MKHRLWVFAVFFFIGVSSCGYHFSGEKDFPFQIKTIFVPIFENNTSETGIETAITNDFIYELVRSGNVRVVEKDRADAFLYGEIKSLSTHTISRTSTRSPLERRVNLVLDLKLTDRHDRILWISRGFSSNESYIVLRDKLFTEAKKHEAIQALSKRMAEQVYYQLMNIEQGF